MPENPHFQCCCGILSFSLWLESEIHHAACLFSDFSNLRKGWGVGGYLFNTHQAGLLGSASLKMGKIMNAQDNSGPLLAGSSVVTVSGSSHSIAPPENLGSAFSAAQPCRLC